MRGLGQPLQLQDTQQAHDMLEEMGKTVRAMVEGCCNCKTSRPRWRTSTCAHRGQPAAPGPRL